MLCVLSLWGARHAHWPRLRPWHPCHPGPLKRQPPISHPLLLHLHLMQLLMPLRTLSLRLRLLRWPRTLRLPLRRPRHSVGSGRSPQLRP